MGVLLALASSAVWGFSDFFGGTLSRRLRVLTVVTGSESFGLVALVIAALALGSVTAPTGYIGWSIVGGVVGLVGIMAFYRALATGTMGVVAPVASLGVAIPVLVGLLGGNRPSALQDAGMVVAVIGVVLAGGPELRLGESNLRASAAPLGLAGLSAVCFGIYYVSLDRGADTSTVMSLLVMRLTAVVCLLLAAVVRRLRSSPSERVGTERPLAQDRMAGAVAIGALGGLATRDLAVLATIGCMDVLANGLYGVSTRHGLLAVVSVLSSLYPAVTVVMARQIHGERLSRAQITGVAAAILGVAMLASGGAG